MEELSKAVFKKNGKVKFKIIESDEKHLNIIYDYIYMLAERLDGKIDNSLKYYFKVENGKVIRARNRHLNNCSKIFNNLVDESYMNAMQNKS